MLNDSTYNNEDNANESEDCSKYDQPPRYRYKVLIGWLVLKYFTINGLVVLLEFI